MNMKDHILTGLKEQFDQWEEYLASMSEEQIVTPLLPSEWSCKDVMAHLMAWQQRSIARIEAARFKHEPEYPKWPPEMDPDSENDTDRINTWIFETNRDQSWSLVHQTWRKGYLHFLESGEGITERDLLDSGRYPWMKGYPLAGSLLASYDHHQEHLEKLIVWMKENGE